MTNQDVHFPEYSVNASIFELNLIRSDFNIFLIIKVEEYGRV
tara:strand:- start:7193 stop:7318 length:126 start_codon:yes stop_codon:yes gene_type:complete